MTDLGGYVIILVETKDKKIKVYGKLHHIVFFFEIWEGAKYFQSLVYQMMRVINIHTNRSI